MASMFARFAGLVVCLLLAATAAHATDPKANQGASAASDRCAHAAFKAFPDYTPESNAKRQRAMQQCLAAGNLPPRGPTVPVMPPTPAAPDPQPK